MNKKFYFYKAPWHFMPCRLDCDTLLSSIATLPQSPLPIPIGGYHPQTLFTLPWLPYTSSLPLFLPSFLPLPAHTFLLPTPIYAYNMSIQLLYRRVLHTLYPAILALQPVTTLCLYNCHAWRSNNSVELLHYRHWCSTYLLADWSCCATSFFPWSNHRPSGDTTCIFRYRWDKIYLFIF